MKNTIAQDVRFVRVGRRRVKWDKELHDIAAGLSPYHTHKLADQLQRWVSQLREKTGALMRRN